jgi:hypothetical protein
MTDKIDGESPDKPKKLKGFANPDQRKNIRGTGRETGSKNKKDTLTSKEFSDLVLSNAPEAMQNLMKLMRHGNEATKKAMVAKLMDYALSVTIHNDKMKLTKKDPEGKTKSYTVEENKTGGAQVLKMTYAD